MKTKTYPSDITREQFEHVRPLLESAMKKTKPRKYDLYDIFNGIGYVLKTGCQWDALPGDYPHYKSVHRYYIIWSKDAGRDKDQNSVLKQALKKIGTRQSNQPGAILYDHLFDR